MKWQNDNGETYDSNSNDNDNEMIVIMTNDVLMIWWQW